MPAPTPGNEASLGDLVRQLGSDLSALLRGELALVRKETREALDALKTGAALVAAGAMAALLALGTLTAAAVLALGARMGYTTAALLLGVAFAVLAAAAIAWGARRFRTASLKPEKTLEDLEETKRWMKDLT